MPTFLERYERGDHEPVWNELVALGADVREEPLYSDALAVARETMRRVRVNFERLIPSLVELGYSFGYDHRLRAECSRPFDSARRERYFDLLRWARLQPPVYMSPQHGRQYREHLASLGLEEFDERVGDLADISGDGDRVLLDAAAAIRELDREIGPFPLSIRVWYEEVGAVNLFGYHPNWVSYLKHHPYGVDLPDWYLMSLCDPLQVWPLGKRQIEQLRSRRKQVGAAGLEFAPDPAFKNFTAGSSTPFVVPVPEPGMDAMLESYEPGCTFVDYLRHCLRWGGFPGWGEFEKRPEQDLAFLTKELVPF